MEPPTWAGSAPKCAHGVPRVYRDLFTKDGRFLRMWDCDAKDRPGAVCEAVWIKKPKEAA